MTRGRIASLLATGGSVAVLAAGALSLGFAGPAGATTYATVNGQGSTYAALAFQQWTQAEQLQGLNVNYTATGSPAGLESFQNNTADFAGTEGEYTELYADTSGTPNARVTRGFAYTPDVAGAVAIMYHVALNATGSDQDTYLQLSPMTVARIFMGIITNWDSPTITADNKGLKLPNEPIVLDYRSGQSGTTALFYDFVANTDPAQFVPWAKHNNWNPTHRIWEIDDGAGAFPPPNSVGFTGSTQQAQAVASPSGLWSIGYDEFGYAKVYHDNVAWIENASGNWTQPYALNISAALQTAQLAPTTAQTLKGVYASTNPTAYPISAYSYILYQCATTPARPTCKGAYPNPAVTNTMAKFMRYVACTGQVKMATIGYSPLPTQLSQFMANAIGYMTGTTPPTLTGKDCANPQFQGGSLGVGATPPKDPVATVASLAPTAGASSAAASGGAAATAGSGAKAGAATSGGAAAGGGAGGVAAGGSTAKAASGSTTATTQAAGLAASTSAAQAASTVASPTPVPYLGPATTTSSPWPLITLVALLALPVVLVTVAERRRRRRAARIAGVPVDADALGTEGGGLPSG